MRQSACNRAELRNEAGLVQRSELLVHLDQGLGRVTFQVKLAGGEGERVEDVAHLTVDRLKPKNVVGLPFTFDKNNYVLINKLRRCASSVAISIPLRI